MFTLDIKFESNDAIFNTFHSIFALDTGQLNINAYLTDWDKINDSGMPEKEWKRPTGKHLTVSISDNYRYGDYMSGECAVGDNENFSLKKLRNKNQSEWTDDDYKIAKQIIECYVEFVLSGDKYYHETEKITKSKNWYKKGGLRKCNKTVITNLSDLNKSWGWEL